MKVLAELQRLVASGQTCVLATTVAAHGSTPRKEGARLVLAASGEQIGTVGGGELESLVLSTAKAMLTGREKTCLVEAPACGGTVTTYLEVFAPERQVLVVGAGHVGRAVALAARASSFRATVAAPSAPERMADAPEVATIAAAGPEALASFPEPGATHVIVATGDNDVDVAWSVAALAGPFASVGVVGSAGKAARIRHQAASQGVPPARVATLRCPVGLAIGAVTPAEIAVSIVAELVMLDRAGSVPESWQIKPSA
jgi:xanthine dehydrogenase accessory factor